MTLIFKNNSYFKIKISIKILFQTMKSLIKVILCLLIPTSIIYGQEYFVFTGQTGAANDLDPGEVIRFPFKVSSSFNFAGGSFQIQAGNSGGNITVSVYQDEVSGSPLASRTISSDYIKDTLEGSGYKKVDFRFTSPITLTTGNFYIITISSDTASSSALSKIKDPSGGVYLQSLDENGDPVAGDPIIAEDCSLFTDVSLDCNQTMSGGGGEWSIAKFFPSQTISFNSTFTHEIVLTNIGFTSLDNARVKDQLPTGVTLSSVSGTGWTLTSNSSGLLTLDYSGTVATGATANTLILNLSPDYNFAGATNYASVDPTGGQDPPAPSSSCAVASACASSSSTVTSRSISGTIQNQSNTAVSGAQVTLVNPSNSATLTTITSAGDGSYSFTGLLPGSYNISFSDYSGKTVKARPGNGSGNGTRNATNKSNGINTAAGNISGEDGFVIDPSGVVYDSTSRSAISGAVVSLYVTPSGGSRRLVTSSELDTTNGDDNPKTTSSDGIYNFLLNNTSVSGLYDLTVSKSGYTFQSETIAPESGAYTPAAGGGVEAIQSQATAPTGGQDTTYYLSFNFTIASEAVDSSNGVINNHIPIDEGDSTAPTITGPSGDAGDATSAISVEENQTDVATFTANETGTWTISGTDSSLFSINSSTGVLTFTSAPDYESPGDADTDNDYVVVITATDSSSNASTQTLTVTVTDVQENAIDSTAPTITGPSGDAGDATSAISVEENQTDVATFTANETGTWTISGTDSSLFSINSSTGVLTFTSAPDYESPGDADTDNDYVVVITATDSSSNASTQTLTVTVTDVQGDLLDLIKDDLTYVIERDFEQILITNASRYHSILDGALSRFSYQVRDCDMTTNTNDISGSHKFDTSSIFDVLMNQSVNINGVYDNAFYNCEEGTFETSNLEYQALLSKGFSRRANVHYENIKESRLNEDTLRGIFYGFEMSKNRIDSVAIGNIKSYGISFGNYLIRNLGENYQVNFLVAGHAGKSFYNLSEFQSTELDLSVQGAYRHHSIYYEIGLSGASHHLNDTLQVTPRISASGAHGKISDNSLKIFNAGRRAEYSQFGIAARGYSQALLGITVVNTGINNDASLTTLNLDILCRQTDLLLDRECGGQIEYEKNYQESDGSISSLGFTYSHTKSMSIFGLAYGFKGKILDTLNYETSFKIFGRQDYTMNVEYWTEFK